MDTGLLYVVMLCAYGSVLQHRKYYMLSTLKLQFFSLSLLFSENMFLLHTISLAFVWFSRGNCNCWITWTLLIYFWHTFFVHLIYVLNIFHSSVQWINFCTTSSERIKLEMFKSQCYLLINTNDLIPTMLFYFLYSG